ncbi:MAG: type II secretion system protein GspM [Pseudomonadota bacterium]
MKQYWIKLSTRIDALTLRERVMVFAAVAAGIVFLVYLAWLDPLLAKQKTLHAQLRQTQDNIAGIEAEITQKLELANADPDAPNATRLKAIETEAAQLGATLRAAQQGLVAPDKIVPLLESMLKNNSRLRLLSLKTLPVAGASEAVAAAAKEPAPAEAPAAALQKLAAGAAAAVSENAQGAPNLVKALPKPPELLYRHGVEIALQGSYPDMVAYMATLEAMPTHLFWGKARLDVEEYPKARLTLTLYTLSLEAKWMTL